jgi:DNA-binding GntR family transcriptional regulator
LALDKIEKKTLRQTVYDQLKESIITAELLPGEPISLRGLAAKLGVSQMPVREALWQLEAEKVVVIDSNRSIRVNKLTPDELEEILQIRLALETMAAEKACDRRPDPALPRLQALVAEMWASMEQHNVFSQKNRELHFGIYELAESPILLGLIDGLWARVGPYFNIRVLGSEYLRNLTMPCHQELVAALEARDKVKMRRALEQDLGSTAERILPLLKKPIEWDGGKVSANDG